MKDKMNCPLCSKQLVWTSASDYSECPTLVNILPEFKWSHYSLSTLLETFLFPPYRIFSAADTTVISKAISKVQTSQGDRLIYMELLRCPIMEPDTIISLASLKEHELKEKIDILKTFS